jgi:hypothetical protein
LILQVSSITSHEITSTLTQRSSNSTVYMGLDFAENTLTLSRLLHRVLHMNWKQRRCSGLGSGGRRSCRGSGRSSSTPGTPFGDQEARRRATRETSAWGEKKLRGAGSSGRALRRLHLAEPLAPEPLSACAGCQLYSRCLPARLLAPRGAHASALSRPVPAARSAPAAAARAPAGASSRAPPAPVRASA